MSSSDETDMNFEMKTGQSSYEISQVGEQSDSCVSICGELKKLFSDETSESRKLIAATSASVHSDVEKLNYISLKADYFEKPKKRRKRKKVKMFMHPDEIQLS